MGRAVCDTSELTMLIGTPDAVRPMSQVPASCKTLRPTISGWSMAKSIAKAPPDELPTTTARSTFKCANSFARSPVGENELISAAISGMVSSLDPHSSYMDPKETADMRIQTTGRFGGVGLEVTQENGVLKVVAVRAPKLGS